ncbi:MAG: biopolymer transporter ExbD [Bacteroidaceae bacterium]|nr:biopolymer transporter ExbD [Bacteroidaceae bacterium]
MAKGKRKVPGLNGSSMADISFIMLIFFLVTTSMDTDSGLHVRLPNPPEENVEQDPPKVKQRNTMVVTVNMYNQIMAKVGNSEAKEVGLNELRQLTKDFVANRDNDPKLPELHPVELPAPFGVQNITKNHVISFVTDRATSYDLYFQIENELYGAYNELRDELARKTFGYGYKECNEDQQLAVRQYYKCMISEAEPKNYGNQ